MRFYNSNKIETFRKLMDKIVYDWEFDKRNLIKLDDNTYQVNKTTIGRDFVDYKTEYHELASGVFEKLEMFYNLLEDNNEMLCLIQDLANLRPCKETAGAGDLVKRAKELVK